MFKQMVTAIAAASAVCVGGLALAQVAGSVTLGVTVEEQKVVALGWSAKNQVLGQPVYNDTNESIGEVKDVIIAPDKAVSYAIVGVGGFLGLGTHDVLIPVNRFRVEDRKLKLPGASKDTLKALPNFVYASK